MAVTVELRLVEIRRVASRQLDAGRALVADSWTDAGSVPPRIGTRRCNHNPFGSHGIGSRGQ